jgi:hypothetical protein
MGAKIDLHVTDELQRAVKHLDNVRDIFYSSGGDFFDVPLREHGHKLVAAGQGILNAVPGQLVLAAKEFWYDPQEKLYDGEDYRVAVEEGAALCALFVIMDMYSFIKPYSFSHFSSAVERLGDDLSDLRSYCPAYDLERDTWSL